MATFASSEQAKVAAGDDIQEEGPSTATESRRLNTTEVSSLFNLRSELLRKKGDAVKTSLKNEYETRGTSGLLAVKKDEREQMKREAYERKNRINALAQKIRREEQEALDRSRQRLNEKAMLYDKLASGTVLTHTDETPVEFMVDFTQKSRDEPSGPHPRKAGPAHYIPNEEQRVYGTSHVILSTDEEARQAEIARIKNLSKETEISREKQKKETEERDKLRLEKSNRLRRQMGLPEVKAPSPPPPEPELSVDQIPLPEDRPSDKQEVSFEEETIKRIRADREWDRGKGRFTAWIEKQREERDDDFRPPDSYYR